MLLLKANLSILILPEELCSENIPFTAFKLLLLLFVLLRFI